MTKDYRHYKEQDFLSDDKFLNWLTHKDASEDVFWKEWLLRNPDKKPVVENAIRAYKLFLTFQKNEPPEAERAHVWPAIQSHLAAFSAEEDQIQRFHPANWLKYAAVAAGIICLVIAGIWYRGNAKIEVTSHASIEEVTLPDGSLVMLNAESQLSYRRAFNSGRAREIWIEGKAFLDVASQKVSSGQAVPFIVHLGAMEIEVIGTSFNVLRNDSVSMVILSEGEIQAFVAGRTIGLKPGERLKATASGISKERVNSDLYSAWTNGVFRFNNTGLDEIADLLTEYYGFEVIVEDRSTLESKVISGEVSAKDISSLFKAMELIMGVETDQKGRRVVIRNR